LFLAESLRSAEHAVISLASLRLPCRQVRQVFIYTGRLYFVGFFLAESLRSAKHAGNFLSVTALSPRLREKGNVAYKAA
jgi:hypothetical protein